MGLLGTLVVLLVEGDGELVESAVDLVGVGAALLGQLGLLLLLGFGGGRFLLGLGLSFRLGGLLLRFRLALLGGKLSCGLLIGLSLGGGFLLIFLGLLLRGLFGLSVLLLSLLSEERRVLDLLGLSRHLILSGLGVLELKCLLSLHLLSDLQHLELGLGLAARQLVLSLQSCQVGFSSSLLSGGGLRLLDGLGSEVLLLHALGLKLLGGFLFLENLQLFGALLRELFLFLTLFLGHGDLVLKIFGLLDLKLALLLLELELLHERLLLGLLLRLELHEGSVSGPDAAESISGGGRSKQGHALLVSLFGRLLKGLLHSGEFLSFAGAFGLLGGLNLNGEGLLRLSGGLDVLLRFRLRVLGLDVFVLLQRDGLSA